MVRLIDSQLFLQLNYYSDEQGSKHQQLTRFFKTISGVDHLVEILQVRILIWYVKMSEASMRLERRLLWVRKESQESN